MITLHAGSRCLSAIAVVALATTLCTAVHAQIHGAIFTTDAGGSTNINLYQNKQDVWVNGGPRKEGSAGLPEGYYYIKVTNPNGSAVLGSSEYNPGPAGAAGGPPVVPPVNLQNPPQRWSSKTPIYVGANGEFEVPVNLWLVVHEPNGQNPQGYKNTNNNGGEYKVWIQRMPDQGAFTWINSETKTDNFKVNQPPQTEICVRKVRDTNGNGTEDAGEVGIPNWEIRLCKASNPNQTVATGFTDGGGDICFLVDRDSFQYIVKEIIPSGQGWVATSPVSVTVTASVEHIDATFLNWIPAQICVTKVRDLNANGVRDAGEPLLSGWSFRLFRMPGNELVETVVTGSNGTACFQPVDQDGTTYEVREVIQSNWVVTFPNAQGIHSVTPNQANIELLFLNREPMTVSVAKHRDHNGNGLVDVGDEPLPGWTFSLFKMPANTLIQTIVTGANGTATFNEIEQDGSLYQVRETIQTGWAATFPAGGIAGFAANQPTLQLVFTNWQPINLSVRKFRDTDGDGVLDAGELPIAAWSFQLFRNNVLVATVQTNAQGIATYGPVDMDGTVYQWRETLPAGWAVTTAGGLSQNITANTPNPMVTFGNWMPITLSVRKFRDTDGDGVLDAGELPIAAWTFQLFKNNVLLATVQTNASGIATYGPVDKDGTVYQWRETLPAGWAVTTPGGLAQNTTANTAAPLTTFGNWVPITLSVRKFRDTNGNGTQNSGEAVIVGWPFQLFKNNVLIATVQTNAQGVATFGPVDMDGTVYEWRETLPAGWAVTTGGTSQNTTANVPNPLVTFGNWIPINLTVRKFRDTDGDGVLDVGELPIQGWSFQLFKNNVLVTTVQTNAQGVATYGPVDMDGTVYEWRETLPANWSVTSAGGTSQSTTANTSNPTTTFLNWQPTDLCGVKYYDANTNGTRDVGEPFIQNWLIEIRLKSSNTLVACGHTGANGEFCITVDGDGTQYIIEEVMAEPYKPSTATSVEVAATAPRTAVEFGNYALVPVTLTAYTKGGWQSDNNNFSQTLGHYTHGKKRLNEVDDDWRTLLNSLNLCTTGGQPYTVPEEPANNFEAAFADFAAWLTGSVEGNMAFNLSSQLAAAALNLNYTEYGQYTMVHVFWNNQWVNLADAIQNAANLLNGNCLVTSGHTLYAQMQDLKNMFDAFNNNTLSTKAASPVPVPFVPVPCPE